MQHSHNDHYKWGYNGEWFNKPENGYFQISIGACSRPHKSFREECITVAKLLGEQMSKPILVGLSGGHDSQVVCLSLMEAGVPFTPVILKLFGTSGTRYNQYDIDGAFEFCEKFNLTPIIEELDLDEYYYTELMPLVYEYGFISPEICVQLHLVRKYADTHAYINGGGDPIILVSDKEDEEGQHLTYSHSPLPIQQYMIDHNIEGCLKFFMYTPEIIAAYLDHPIFHTYSNAADAIPPRHSYNYFTYCVKAMMYCTEWPELVKRKKNTGFEKFPYMNKVRAMINYANDWYNPRMKIIKWDYKELLEYLNSNTGEIKIWKSVDERDFY
jgi:hypothetical protein